MRDSYSSNRRGRFGRDDKPEMFDAVCSECGDKCKVPFQPTGEKPIYCSKCFEKVDPKKGSRDSRGRNDFRGRDSRDRNSRGRDSRFGRGRDRDRDRDQDRGGSRGSSADVSQLKDQLGSMSAKLDKILRILENVTGVKPEIEKSDSE